MEAKVDTDVEAMSWKAWLQWILTSTMDISFPWCIHMNAKRVYRYPVWKPGKDLEEFNIRGEIKGGIEPS